MNQKVANLELRTTLRVFSKYIFLAKYSDTFIISLKIKHGLKFFSGENIETYMIGDNMQNFATVNVSISFFKTFNLTAF